jgi:transcriptional regulator with XRE-family HTH domain
MEQDHDSKVQLDGSTVRKIREKQKLTQYYISKVVGVTIDTVSRWENNRYPTVRRENALLLSEALEVPIEEILLKDVSVPLRRSFSSLAAGITAAVLLLSLLLYFILTRAPALDYQLSVERLLPPHVAVATQLPVSVAIKVTGSIDGMVLRENFPKGFKLVEASPIPSSLDNMTGSARWILPVAESLQINYLLQPDPAIKEGETLLFQGELIVKSKGENKGSAVLGETVIPVDVYHWADVNRDLIIDDGEALDASVLSIAMKNVHINWELVEDIWDAGSYRLDLDSHKFVAIRNSEGG